MEQAVTESAASAAAAAQSADRAEAAQTAVEDLTVSAETLAPGSAATVEKTEIGGVVNLGFGIPQGAQGPTGATGPQGPQGEKGEKGDPGEVTLAQLQALLPVDSASGAIATFPDGSEFPVKVLTAAISPVQDLHGYGNPWPAGGGKNLLKFNVADAQRTQNGVTAVYDADTDILSITGTNTSDTAFGLLISTTYIFPDFAVGDQYKFVVAPVSGSVNPDIYFQISYKKTGGATAALVNTSGIKAFTVPNDFDHAYNIFVGVYATASTVDYKVRLMVVKGDETDTSYAPYSNICPISGWDAVNVVRTGKNLYHYDDNNVSTCTMSNGVTQAVYRTGVRGGTYTFTASLVGDGVTTSNVNISAYKGGIATVKNSFIAPGGITTRTFTFADDEEVVFTTASEAPSSMSLNLPKYNIQIEHGETATAYAPYTGQTYPISLGRTVYGGTLDVTTGVLTVDRAMVDLGTLTWSLAGSGRLNSTINDQKFVPQNEIGNAKCSAYKTVSNYTIQTIGESSIAVGINGKLIQVNDKRYNGGDPAAFKTAVSGVQLVYELATPQTYQLTPTEVTTLLGDNCLWTDTGNVTVVYTADIQRYIQKLTA